ncbi:hypothetical protein AWC23_03660 [Mycobacterium saskatchewanense]|uniref:Uncharacterized protein n=1 Tax=Mycobacterium saskatchewanense TaxID=220927 RepID=A0AAJ3NVG0_9MYCO|nr:hypothetical protein AWC23_03660 [Mycobacterium saskatchewanense]
MAVAAGGAGVAADLAHVGVVVVGEVGALGSEYLDDAPPAVMAGRLLVALLLARAAGVVGGDPLLQRARSY